MKYDGTLRDHRGNELSLMQESKCNTQIRWCTAKIGHSYFIADFDCDYYTVGIPFYDTEVDQTRIKLFGYKRGEQVMTTSMSTTYFTVRKRNNYIIERDEGRMPDWCWDVVDDIEDMYGYRPKGFQVMKPFSTKRTKGTYWGYTDCIRLTLGTDDKHNLWTLLHELGHGLQYVKFPESLPKKVPGKKRVCHPATFWKIMYPIYKKYDVLDLAIQIEYKTGRKILKGMRDNDNEVGFDKWHTVRLNRK